MFRSRCYYHQVSYRNTNSIKIYSYIKTNQMHNISNLFCFETTLYIFRTVSPPIIRSLRLYIQYNTTQVLWLPANRQPQRQVITWEIVASSWLIYWNYKMWVLIFSTNFICNISLRTGSFKLFKRPFPGFLTILTL